MSLLLILSLTLCMWTIFAQQQTIIAPLSYTAFLDLSDVSVRFTCTGEGVAVWRVDKQAPSSTEIINRGIFTETNDDGGNFTSQIIIPATVENNNTEVQCWAVSDIVVLSETATFIIQGPLAPPPNLTIVDTEADACSIYKLVWSAPFTLDVSGVDPDISTYTICSNITGYYTCSNTSGSGVMEHVFPRPFRYVEFRVSAVNGAGQGSESSVVYKPDNISTNVIFENATSPSVNVSFQVNCSKSYNIVIVGSNNESVSSHSATPDVDGNVVVTVDSGLEGNERYNFTVTEDITEGMKGNPSVSFTTFDVQDADTVPGAGEITVTCHFAVGSKALGCHVRVVNSTTDEEVRRGNITRENSMDGAPMPMNATGELSGLEMGIYYVFLYDIEYDYSIDLNEVAKSAEIIVAAPIIATTVKFTDASSTTDDGPTVVNSNAIPTSTLVVPATTPVEPAGAGSSTVGIAVGVLLSAVAVLMVTVLILVLVLILKHKRKLKHSPINTVSYSTTQNSAGSNAGRYTDMPLKTGTDDDYLNSIGDFIGAPLPPPPPSYEAVNAVSQRTTSTIVSQEPLYANTGTSAGTGTRQEPQYANTGVGHEEPQYANAGVEKQQDPVYANAKEVLPEKKQEKKPEVQYAELGPMASNMPAAPPPMETEVQYSTVQGQPKRQAPPPLLNSCEVGNIDGVRQAIAAEGGEMDGRTLNYKNTEDGLTPLHLAAMHGHLEIVELLLEQPQAKADVRDKKRCTPLHLACKEGHLEVVKVLVSQGASLEMEDYPNKWTPLHHASAKGHTQVVMYLIQAGSCVDHQDFEQCTPLFGACKEGHLEVVKCLVVEGKANVHHRDKDKHTPLHATSARGHIGVVMFLVNEAGADVFSRDNKARTPWEYASINVHLEVANFLQQTMEKKHHEATLSNARAPAIPPKGEGSTPLQNTAALMLPPKGEKRTSATVVPPPPPPPPVLIPTSPVAVATAADSIHRQRNMETVSLPGSVPDDSCEIDVLNVSVASHSTPATRSPSRFEMGVVQPQGEGLGALVMEASDLSNASELVFAGSRRSIVNSESETRNVDNVVVSTMRRTEAREPPKRGGNDDSFHVIRSGGSALIASNYELPAVEHTGFQNLSETEKQLGIFSYIFSNIWKENLSALTNTLSKLIRTDVLGAYYKLF